MNVMITARHFKARPELKEFINEKINKLKTFYDNILDAEVILSFVKDEKTAEIKLRLDDKSHKRLVITDTSDDMFKSVEQATERLRILLTRHKGKRSEFSHEKVVEHIQKKESEKKQMDEF